MDPLIIRAAERAATDFHFFAHHLGPDLHAAADRLGVSVKACCHLYLCPAPRSMCELRRIAERNWITEEQLREVMGW